MKRDMITTNDEAYNKLVDDLFTSLDREVEEVLRGLVPRGGGPLKLYLLKERETVDTLYAKHEGMIVVAATKEDAQCVPFLDINDGWPCSGLVTYETRHLLVVTEVGTANPYQVANKVLLTSSL